MRSPALDHMPRRTGRRAALAALAVAVALVGVAVVGRVERRHWVTTQVRGMARIQALVGRLDSPTLSGYRVLPAFDCLVYRRGSNPFALEGCVDGRGPGVETIDP